MKIRQPIELTVKQRMKLIHARKLARMTQGGLAMRLGVSRPYVSEIETGKKKPSSILLRKIAKILKLNFQATVSITLDDK